MRKSKEEKAETRQRIISVAAKQFREKGISGSGLAELMKVAGLTHGGFYKHFESKDELVAEATIAAVRDNIAIITCSAETKPGIKGLDAAMAEYLSTEHRDLPGIGCMIAGVGSEFARCDAATREAVTECFREYVDVLAAHCGDIPPAEARKKAIAIAATMIGAMTISRIVNDPQLSESILKSARDFIHTSAM